MTRKHRYHSLLDDRQADAVSYPMSKRGLSEQRNPGNPRTPSTMVAAPGGADRELMASLGIEVDAGAYRFEGVRFDCLADAVNHARFAARHQEDAGGR